METTFDDLSRAVLQPRKASRRRPLAIALVATVAIGLLAIYQLRAMTSSETVRAGVCYFAECAS